MARGLLKATVNVGAMTLISRILGFVRDMVIARTFGASTGADAFFVAFKIPNFLRRLFAEGAFSQAFVPVLTEYKTRRTPEEVKDLVDHVSGALATVLFLVTAVGIVAAPLLIMLFAPGFSKDATKFQLAADMLRITFPYLLFISLTAFAGGILNAYGRFAVPAFTPTFLNLAMIAAALWLAPQLDQPITALAWGVFIAGVVQLLFQWPYLRQLGLMPRFRFKRAHEGVSRILRLMVPVMFGSSVAQINLLVDTLIASFLVTGSVSWLYYSDRLVEFPLGVFGVALATVILPKLSQHHAQASPEAFSRTIDWGLRWVVLVSVPATVGLIALAVPLISTLFHYGEFTDTDVLKSSYSLTTFSLGLLGFIMVKILASGFYSRQDTRTPVRFALVAMLANVIMNLLFVWPLAHAGLALATSLAALLNAALLLRALRRSGAYQPEAGWGAYLWRIAAAGAAMAAALAWGAGTVEQWTHWSAVERLGHLMLWIAVGSVVFAAVALATGLRPRHLQLHGDSP